MEKEINIAKILKNKPEGTKLWTDMFGEVTLYVVTNTCDAFQVKHHNKEPWFDEDGTLYKEGALCIYPSKSMRDWEKFDWKKGDVLVSKKDNIYIIFEEFENDDYTRFKGKYYLWRRCGKEDYRKEKTEMLTSEFKKANYNDAQIYIKAIEERLGGILNRKTFEVEALQEFNDGDVVTAFFTDGNKMICVFKEKDDQFYMGYCGFYSTGSLRGKICLDFNGDCICDDARDCKIKLATEEEEKELFSALAKEGKVWDSEHKMIVDLKPKVEFKPFDKVLVRNTDTEEWFPGFFEKFDSTWNNPYHIMNRRSMTDFAFKQCIPYIGNESLLGTTDNFE